MANYRTTLIADTAGTAIVTCTKPRTLTEWMATINAYGTFGGGTLSYKISTNGGTTKVAMKDISGSSYSATADDVINVATGVANNNGKEPIIYAVLTGSTNPNIVIDVMDNT